MLQCFSAIAKGQVDTEAGIIRRVSVLTEGMAIGHAVLIDATTLSQVKTQAEIFPDGVRVKMNHGTGVESIAGVLRNFVIEAKQLFGDLHLLKTGDSYNKLIEMAQTIPGAFGLSICFQNTPEKIGEDLFSRCSKLFSVDLVDEPAANPSGLFSIPTVDSPQISKTMLTELQAVWKTLGEKITALVGKPEAAELTAVKTDLSALGEKITTELTAALSAKTALEAQLATATTNLSAATGQIASLQTTHTAAATALRSHLSALPGHADYKDGGAKAGATLSELITAEQNATNTAIASTGVKADKLPAVGAIPPDALNAPKNLTEACLKANKAAA
jgi:hypothetical protein